MARITDDEIERLKQDVDLVELVRGHGVELTAQGDDLVGHCPFHDGDDTPSFHVTPAQDRYDCFGCSAASDDVMDGDGMAPPAGEKGRG